MSRAVLNVFVRSALMFLLWMLLVDTLDERQLLAGVGVTVFAVLLSMAIPGSDRSRIRIQPVMVRRLYRPLALLVSDTVLVTAILLARVVRRRASQGRFRAVRYSATGESHEDGARRVLTEWAGSVAPNRYVIGIDRRRHVLLIHELGTSSSSIDPLQLG